MVADSEKFAEEDELIKKKIEARNQFENCKFYRPHRVRDNSLTLNHIDSHIFTQITNR
jgi:hypothetical protein